MCWHVSLPLTHCASTVLPGVSIRVCGEVTGADVWYESGWYAVKEMLSNSSTMSWAQIHGKQSLWKWYGDAVCEKKVFSSDDLYGQGAWPPSRARLSEVKVMVGSWCKVSLGLMLCSPPPLSSVPLSRAARLCPIVIKLSTLAPYQLSNFSSMLNFTQSL